MIKRRTVKKGKIYIGTSGWSYEHWKGPFYPEDLATKDLLNFYIQQLKTVEINRTFYSLPDRDVFSRYAKTVPSSFIFAVKASRFITHVKRLKNPKLSLKRLFSRIQPLGRHLGPILFQLPPHWKVNKKRLQSFLEALPKKYRFAFEFRDESWLTKEIFDLLKKRRAAFCIYELGHVETPCIETADFIYVRLHGPKEAYAGSYSLAALKKWARYFRKEAKKGRDVYCYFDNDEAGYAAMNAKIMLELLK